MRPRYLLIILISSLASASFTAAFVMFNSNYSNKSLVRVKQIQAGPESIDYKMLMSEIRQLKSDQSKLQDSLNSMLEDVEMIQTELIERSVGKAVVDATKDGNGGTENGAQSKDDDANNKVKDVDKKSTASNEKPAKSKDQESAKKKNEEKSLSKDKATVKKKVKAEKVAKIDKKPKKKKKSKKLTAVQPNGRHLYLVREFKKEDRDPDWSSSAMVQIMESINKKVTQTSEFLSMDCRTTFCRLKVKHKNKKLASGFLKRLSEALQWSNSTLEVFFFEESRIVTDIFIFRSGDL